MACPTCDHTMQSLGGKGSRRYYWCPRCGTLKTIYGTNGALENNDAPKLVGYCRQFFECIPEDGDVEVKHLFNEWHETGISECIATPDGR